MKSILITGASGFIGSYLSKFFYKKEYLIFGAARCSPNKSSLKYFNTFINENLLGEGTVNLIKKIRPDFVFHCAGNSSIQNSIKYPLNDFENNTILTFKILNCLKDFSPNSRFYFFSSAAVYGDPPSLPIKESEMTNPISPYGFHKLLSENICTEFSKLYSLNIVILRIFSTYGSGLKRQIFYDLIDKFINNENIILKGNGTESRDFIHIIDLCKAIELIMNSKNDPLEIFNIGSGEETTIEEIATKFAYFINSSKRIKYDLEKNEGMPLNWKADITKLKKIGFNKSIEFSNGLKDYINWYKNEKKIYE